MDVVLKKYFWVVHLAAIGMCSGLLGRAGSHIVEQVALASDDAAPHRVSGPPPVETKRDKDTDGITKRNVFCSACAPVVTAVVKTDAASGELVPPRTTLPLELVSTMVVPEDGRWSMAVIRDTSSKDKEASLFGIHSSLPGANGQAVVTRIGQKIVMLNNGGHVEYLDLEGGAAPPPAAAANVALVTNGDPADEGIGTHVRCTNGGASCEIDRSLVDQMLQNTTALATAARFVPSIKDGHPNGFKLYAIRPSSIFGRIGLQNGDTIKQINGMEMTSPDQALGVYTKVRNASHLTVSVERRGDNVTLDYTIR